MGRRVQAPAQAPAASPVAIPVPADAPPGILVRNARTRAEIGRVQRAGGAWQVFAREADGGYLALGPHADFAAALSALPDAIPASTPAAASQPAKGTAKGMAKGTATPAGRRPAAARRRAAQSDSAESERSRAPSGTVSAKPDRMARA